jgi:hypothetical protein
MATSNFKVFNENFNNAETDAQYTADAQRIGGVVPGVAPSALHNKLYRQTSIMAAALGQVVADQGYDASDADLTALEQSLKSALINPATIDFMSRQAIINGNFDVWQRGTSFTNPNGYTADRVANAINADGGSLPANIIHSRQTLTPGDIPSSYYFYRINVDGAGSGFGVNAAYEIYHRIENATRFLCGLNKKLTLTFYARSTIANKRIGVQFSQRYGTGGSPSASENINGQIFNLTSNWQKFAITITTNTLVGKVFGSNDDDYLQIRFPIIWGSTTASTYFGGGTAETFGSAGNIDIAQIQLNAGDQALPIQPRSYAEELVLCQRYLERIGAGVFGQWFSATSAKLYGSFKTQKRVAPTFTLYSSTPSIEEIGVADRSATGATITDNAANSLGFTFTIGGFSGATSGNRAGSRQDFVFADAEL